MPSEPAPGGCPSAPAVTEPPERRGKEEGSSETGVEAEAAAAAAAAEPPPVPEARDVDDEPFLNLRLLYVPSPPLLLELGGSREALLS